MIYAVIFLFILCVASTAYAIYKHRKYQKLGKVAMERITELKKDLSLSHKKQELKRPSEIRPEPDYYLVRLNRIANMRGEVFMDFFTEELWIDTEGYFGKTDQLVFKTGWRADSRDLHKQYALNSLITNPLGVLIDSMSDYANAVELLYEYSKQSIIEKRRNAVDDAIKSEKVELAALLSAINKAQTLNTKGDENGI